MTQYICLACDYGTSDAVRCSIKIFDRDAVRLIRNADALGWIFSGPKARCARHAAEGAREYLEEGAF